MNRTHTLTIQNPADIYMHIVTHERVDLLGWVHIYANDLYKRHCNRAFI